MDEFINLLNPGLAPLNAADPQLQNINFQEPYPVAPNLNPLPDALGTSPPRPSTSGYQPPPLPPPPQQPLPLQPPQQPPPPQQPLPLQPHQPPAPPAAPIPPLPNGKRPPGRPVGSGQGVKRISGKKRVSSPTGKNKKRVSVGKGKKRVSPKKRVSKSGGGKGRGGCGKRPPGRPRGSVSKTKTGPITIIHPHTGDDFAQMECAFLGDNRQNRENVHQYRLQYPADAYERLDGNSSGLFLKSVRT